MCVLRRRTSSGGPGCLRVLGPPSPSCTPVHQACGLPDRGVTPGPSSVHVSHSRRVGEGTGRPSRPPWRGRQGWSSLAQTRDTVMVRQDIDKTDTSSDTYIQTDSHKHIDKHANTFMAIKSTSYMLYGRLDRGRGSHTHCHGHRQDRRLIRRQTTQPSDTSHTL